MAIDTENKRRSVLGIWGGVRVLPVPDGTVGVRDRKHLWLYRSLTVVSSLFQKFIPFVVLVKKTPVEVMVIKRTVSEDVER